MVVNGDYHEFEPEKLRGLMKILPEMDEVSLDDDANGLLDEYVFVQFKDSPFYICPI